ncbi:MAG: hypothetical protein DCO97_11265 [Marivita sp. XM-24bin2]|jgi:hypothetical protein|nr:MAG: hypothetical protein DCO97_11265 [Marivita sp. XM-24bin2]
MGKSHPTALWERVVAFVEEGQSHRFAAARFRVSVKVVNDMVILKRETGGLALRMRYLLRIVCRVCSTFVYTKVANHPKSQ